MSASGVSGSNYVVPPELQGGSIPDRTYRGDSRPPDEIFSNGFQYRENGTLSYDSLLNFALTNNPSPYVSTSRDSDVAADFAYPNGWVYEINTPRDRAIDVNHVLGEASPIYQESEIAVAGGINAEDIIRATNAETGEVRENPYYDEPVDPPTAPNPSAPEHDDLRR